MVIYIKSGSELVVFSLFLALCFLHLLGMSRVGNQYKGETKRKKKSAKKKISKKKLSTKIYKLADIIDKLEFDRVSIYSITSHHIADSMTNILLYCWDYYFYQYAQSPIHILDAMSCVGLGNTYSFLENTLNKERNVVLILNELNNKRYEMLKNNINTMIENDYIYYNMNDENIFIYNNDIIFLHYYLNYDYKLSSINIIFLDPSWGGINYKNKNKLRLKIQSIGNNGKKYYDLEKVINLMFKYYVNTRIIAIKLPLNYDYKWFKQCINEKYKNKNILMIQINYSNQSLMICIKCEDRNYGLRKKEKLEFCSFLANSFFPNQPENVRIV